MTVERKIVVGLEDIQAICLECLNEACRFKISLSPDHKAKVPEQCPQCDRRWMEVEISGHMSKQVLPFVNFSQSLEVLRASIREVGNKAGFRILLEFAEPS